MSWASDFVRRGALIVIALILGATGCSSIASPAAAAAPPRQVHTHVYDGDHGGVDRTHNATQRGPPATAYASTAVLSAGDQGSFGDSARPGPARTLTYTAYDHTVQLGQIDSGRATTQTASPGRDADGRTLSGRGCAANGGASAVRLGQAGENAVRGVYDIGPKATRVIGTRTRIFDGLSDEAVSEVKNVGYQAYTQQLKDSLTYAQQNGLRFDLFVRGGATPTRLSGPLEAAIRNGDITLRYIP